MDPIPRELLESLGQGAPLELDLTNAGHLDDVRTRAEALEAASESAAQLQATDARCANDDALPLPVRVALKLALSRRLLHETDQPLHVSVVFAMYKEHLRILTSEEHPAGEDFLREKLRQLRWLFGPTPRHTWDLTAVDDGCPEGSGRLAKEILERFAEPEEETRVLFLEDAIRQGLPVTRDLDSADQSQKGGSIRLGLWSAAQARRAGGHAALFTDADLSTHLGQIGLLVAPLMGSSGSGTGSRTLAPPRLAAIGSRRESSSVVVKARTRNVRGKLFIYLWKRLIPQLRGIIDTQCGFKAFDARHLATWIEDTRDNGFSFDVEFLLRVQLDRPGSIAKVPVAWIDSEAASTTAELEPYLPMLRSIVRLYRRELPRSGRAEPFAGLIDELDAETFNDLVARVPPEIADREPLEFDDFDGVSAQALAEVVGLGV
jgi:hypothetical protein